MSIKTKKILSIVALVLCIAGFAITTTTAFLISRAGPVENVFTIGDIRLSLTETTGESYQLIPGKVVDKNPTVTVHGGSEDCWLFVKVTKSKDFDEYIEYEIADGWTHLGGYEGVYYRSIIRSASGDVFSILKDDRMSVVDTLTEEKMTAIATLPKITFEAYAVQSHSIDTASEAWVEILKEVIE